MKNEILTQAALAEYAKRENDNDNIPFSARIETTGWGNFVSLWFKTTGCSYSRAGSCLPCNYGKSGHPVTAEEIVSSVAEAVQYILDNQIKPDSLSISPSGSMFDEKEVPPSARKEIWKLIRSVPGNYLTVETRPETLNKRVLREYRSSNQRTCYVEMGLESANPDVLRYSFNKRLSLKSLDNALNALGDTATAAIINILVGSPFLNPEEMIADSVNSVSYVQDKAIERAVLFPLAIRDGTLMTWLRDNRLYKSPPLWALIEVLRALKEREVKGVSIAWYKKYVYQSNVSKIEKNSVYDLVDYPYTCDRCYNRVVESLDGFRATGDFNTLDSLDGICSCRDNWKERYYHGLDGPFGDPTSTFTERLLYAYEKIAREYLGWNSTDIKRILNALPEIKLPVQQ